MKKTNILVLALICLAGTLHAQTPAELKEQFIKDWTRAKEYTSQYLKAMPANKYNAKAADSIRTFSEQMLHLASANIFFGSWATAKPGIFSGFNMEKSAGAQSHDSTVYYVNASYDYVIESLKALDAAKLGELAPMGKNSFPRYLVLSKGFEHQTHHRGQCTIYIRSVGVRPPNEMLF